jgi:hypothetical protein
VARKCRGEATSGRVEQDADDQTRGPMAREQCICHGDPVAAKRHVLVGREGRQQEDRHEALTYLKLVDAADQLARARASEVVEEVVTVGGELELADPGERDRGRSVDRDGAVKPEGCVAEDVVAGHR